MMCKTQEKRPQARSEEGIGLIEVMLAALMLMVGIMALLALFTQAIAVTQISNLDMIARQKAREALESIYTARNTQQFTFEELANVGQGGVFLNGFKEMTTPGADGLVNTADDGAVEKMKSAGLDGKMGTSDDEVRPLSAFNFQRRIEITDAGGPDLRRVRITITFSTPLATQRQVEIESLVSRFR